MLGTCPWTGEPLLCAGDSDESASRRPQWSWRGHRVKRRRLGNAGFLFSSSHVSPAEHVWKSSATQPFADAGCTGRPRCRKRNISENLQHDSRARFLSLV